MKFGVAKYSTATLKRGKTFKSTIKLDKESKIKDTGTRPNPDIDKQ